MRSHSKTFLIPVFVALSLSSIQAQEPMGSIDPSFFKGRRQALMAQLDSGIVVLRGNGRQGAGLDGFTQTESFYYLTGIEQQNTALILFPETGRDILLVEPYSRFTAQWEGFRVVPSEAHAKQYQYDEIRAVTGLPRILSELIAEGLAGSPPKVWTTGGGGRRRGRPNEAAANAQFRDPQSSSAVFVDDLRSRYEGIEIDDVTRIIASLRGVKQESEIARIAEATRIACDGIAEAMKSTVPGVYEFQIAAAARYVFHRNGARQDAYAAIVGAGINGCVLHYSINSKRAESGEIVVMDYAPKFQGYASDVTRTFPVNGEFSPEQRKLVQDVYDVQQILISLVKPGATLGEISRRSQEELAKRGYVSAHGPSHHVGLNVHDKGGNTLEPGMLITIEPGAYLRDQEMGCRIEDVILVTEDGNINLSGHLPSKPEEIEALMRGEGVQQTQVGLQRKQAVRK